MPNAKSREDRVQDEGPCLDIADVMDELWQNYGPTGLEPGEFTIRDLADEKNVTYDTAKGALVRALRAGRVARRRVGQGWAWRYIERM